MMARALPALCTMPSVSVIWRCSSSAPASDFNDPRLAYRRLFSELLGTFMLVLVAAGGGILHATG